MKFTVTSNNVENHASIFFFKNKIRNTLFKKNIFIMFTNCSIDQTDVQGMYDWKKNKSVTKRVSLNGRLAIRKSEKYFPLINKNMQILYGYIIFLKSLQSYLYAYKIFIHITV